MRCFTCKLPEPYLPQKKKASSLSFVLFGRRGPSRKPMSKAGGLSFSFQILERSKLPGFLNSFWWKICPTNFHLQRKAYAFDLAIAAFSTKLHGQTPGAHGAEATLRAKIHVQPLWRGFLLKFIAIWAWATRKKPESVSPQ